MGCNNDRALSVIFARVTIYGRGFVYLFGEIFYESAFSGTWLSLNPKEANPIVSPVSKAISWI